MVAAVRRLRPPLRGVSRLRRFRTSTGLLTQRLRAGLTCDAPPALKEGAAPPALKEGAAPPALKDGSRTFGAQGREPHLRRSRTGAARSALREKLFVAEG